MKKDAVKIICQNRKAYFDYFIDDVIEAGIVLIGRKLNPSVWARPILNDGFARIHKGEVYLHNATLALPFHPPGFLRPHPHRKLLLHRREIKRLIGKTEEKGYTLIPLKLYFFGINTLRSN